MISLDTNAVVRLLLQDDSEQSAVVRQVLQRAEDADRPVLLLSAVVLETVWVLQSCYSIPREAVADAIGDLLGFSVLHVPQRESIIQALLHFRERGDFEDMLIAAQSKALGAQQLFTFDKKLQKILPGFATQEA